MAISIYWIWILNCIAAQITVLSSPRLALLSWFYGWCLRKAIFCLYTYWWKVKGWLISFSIHNFKNGRYNEIKLVSQNDVLYLISIDVDRILPSWLPSCSYLRWNCLPKITPFEATRYNADVIIPFGLWRSLANLKLWLASLWKS